MLKQRSLEWWYKQSLAEPEGNPIAQATKAVAISGVPPIPSFKMPILEASTSKIQTRQDLDRIL